MSGDSHAEHGDDIVVRARCAAAAEWLEAGHVVARLEAQANAVDPGLATDGAIGSRIVRGVELQLAMVVAPRANTSADERERVGSRSEWLVVPGVGLLIDSMFEIAAPAARSTTGSHDSTSMNAAFAARLFGLLAFVVVLFQLALAAGAPWGALAMGGAFPGRLPAAMRIAAVAQALLLLLLAAIVAARAGLVLPRWRVASRKLIWGVAAFLLLGALLNAITPSPWERLLWLPVVLLQLGCAVVVARSEMGE
jgi:hypothetical protein